MLIFLTVFTALLAGAVAYLAWAVYKLQQRLEPDVDPRAERAAHEGLIERGRAQLASAWEPPTPRHAWPYVTRNDAVGEE
jgi:hypothetical protein